MHLQLSSKTPHNPVVVGSISVTANQYQRTDVLRILRITPRQLSGWQRAGLIAVGESFSFFDLLQLKKVRDLRARRVKPSTILASLQAMQKQVDGMTNPLVEAGTFSVGSRVAFRTEGRALEPLNGQFVMEFEDGERVIETPSKTRSIILSETAMDFFARGVALEEDPTTSGEAITNYNKVLELDPDYAPAHINLGTLHYNRGDYRQAEKCYRKAIELDPKYALAYFDLGNVLDETGRIPEAIRAYQTAVQIAPTYADAHYNLALAFEKNRQARKALAHWRAYLKLDSVGPWAIHARNQMRRLMENEKLKVVFRRSRPTD